MSLQSVVRICVKLEKEGKKPSVALVKSRLSHSVSLATVIKGVQQYKDFELSDFEEEEDETAHLNEEHPQCTCFGDVIELKKEVSALKAQIINLQKLVQAQGLE